MATEGTYVEGLRETVKNLLALGVDLEDLKDTMAAIAAEAANVAQAHAPSRTGRLRASIRGNRAKGKAVVTAGKARVPYAAAINYGWRKRGIRGVGFMQAADRVVGPHAVSMLEDGINDAIRKRGME